MVFLFRLYSYMQLANDLMITVTDRYWPISIIVVWLRWTVTGTVHLVTSTVFSIVLVVSVPVSVTCWAGVRPRPRRSRGPGAGVHGPRPTSGSSTGPPRSPSTRGDISTEQSGIHSTQITGTLSVYYIITNFFTSKLYWTVLVLVFLSTKWHYQYKKLPVHYRYMYEIMSTNFFTCKFNWTTLLMSISIKWNCLYMKLPVNYRYI